MTIHHYQTLGTSWYISVYPVSLFPLSMDTCSFVKGVLNRAYIYFIDEILKQNHVQIALFVVL